MGEEEKDVDVKQVGGGMMLVDPNPSGRDVLPAEDMFIYISLSAKERSRGVVTVGENENEFEESRFGVIEFVATEVKYNAAGEPHKDIMGDAKSYATTSYTNIGGMQNSFGSGMLEGFGISSINIKYNTSLIPQVDIDFTDVRGSGLFDVIEQDNRKSPYSIFFKMPYPVFTLTVKGYFGKPVEYCLNLVNWNSKFDAGTGNFNISANFLGFQQAFLADITIGDIIGTVNTEQGLKNLIDLPLTVGSIKEGSSTETKTIPTPQLDEFVKNLSLLQIDLESLKVENEKYKEIQILNTQKQKIKQILDFIGRPIPKANIDTYKNKTTAPPYLKQLNMPDNVNTSPIKSTSLKTFKNYLSIRDILFVKTTVVSSLNTYMNDLNNLIEDYVNFYGENRSKLNTNDKIAKSSGSGAEKNEKYWPFSNNLNGENVNYDQFKMFEDGRTGNIILSDFIDELKGENSPLTENNPEQYSESNQNFDKSIINLEDYANDIQPTPNKNSEFTSSMPGIVLDFRAIRMMVNDMLLEIEKKKEKKSEKLIEELNEALSVSLGYKPTIGTVFQILCNNAQAFLMTIYDIGAAAENKNNDRQKALESASVTSDLQLKEESNFKSQTIYAFPSLYVKEDGGFVEKFIGSPDVFSPDDKVARNAFPEIEFIEDLIKALLSEEKNLLNITKQVNKAKKSSSGDDTENWIPINPIDYKSNPFYLLNSAQSKSAEGKEVLYEKFIKILLDRFIILKYYSQAQTISKYGTWDALWANLSFIDPTIRNTLYTFLQDGNNSTKIGEFIIERLEELNSVEYQLEDLNDEKIYQLLNPNMSLFILGNSVIGKQIIGSNISLSEEQKNNTYKNVFIDNKVIDPSVKNYTEWDNDNLNINSNLCYVSWLKEPQERLLEKAGDKGSMVFYMNQNITLIDGGVNPTDNPDLSTPTPNEWINLYTKESAPIEGLSNTEKTKYLTDSKFYSDNTSELSKALLLLSTLPFKDWNDVIMDNYPKNGGELSFINPPSILQFPKYYLLYIGGTLWREGLGVDPIVWDNSIYSGPSIPTQTEYIKPLWYEKGKGIGNALIELPTQTKTNLIKYFTDWVNKGDFLKFSDAVIEYSDDELSIDDKYQKGKSIASKLNKKENLIVVSYDGILGAASTSQFKLEGFDTYFDSFKSNFKGTLTDPLLPNSNTEEQKDTTKDMSDIKQAAFNSIKNVYDRWVAGATSKSDLAFNACVEDNKDLFKYFQFVDRGFNDIGDKAIINLESVITLSQNLTTNMYFYMSKLLRDSNFLFQILPNYINYKDPEEVSTMFKPITNISDRNDNSGPTYLCIYAGGSSQVLNIEEQNRYTFKNDGFNLDFPPSDILAPKGSKKKQARQQNRKEKKRARREAKGKSVSDNSSDNVNLVGFRVSFGTENQTVFKSVSLNQQEHKDTAEYHKTLTDLIDKRGGTSRSYQGTDLYRMFRSRSYTCSVEALGCMNIQPMMYFQLDNVPFFDGAYMILNVTHNISPNHMTTSFTGVRQSKYITPVVDKMTTFLNIGLDDTLDTEPFYAKSAIVREVDYNTGIPADKGPDQAFNFDSLEEKRFISMGITTTSTNFINTLKSSLKSAGIKSNSQVTMFLANAMTKSKNFTENVLIWNNPESDEGFGLFTEVGNPFGNLPTNPKDGYRFRPRGYIPIIGRDQYLRFSEDTNTPMTKLTGDTIDVETSWKISTWRWTNYPYSESYQFLPELKKTIDNVNLKSAQIKRIKEKLENVSVPSEKETLLTDQRVLLKDIEALRKKAEEISLQVDPMLKTEENYPPGGWANGGQASNFSQTVESLNFKGGKDLEESFENFAIVLNTFPTKDGGDVLIGQTVGGNKFKNKGVNVYKEKKIETPISYLEYAGENQ